MLGEPHQVKKTVKLHKRILNMFEMCLTVANSKMPKLIRNPY